MKKILTILTLIALTFIIKGEVFATVRCETQYGGGETCVKTGELQIDKKVWNPQTSSYVDNLGLNTYTFSAENEITFKIIVKNVGDETLNDIKVTDNLPSYLNALSGDFSYTIDHLNAGQFDERTIKAKVVTKENLPTDKDIVCVSNNAKAKNSEFDTEDNAQVCIEKVEKKILGEKTPATGPEMFLPILLASSTGLFGFSLIRKFKAN